MLSKFTFIPALIAVVGQYAQAQQEKRTGWLDEDGNYHPNEVIQNDTAEDGTMVAGWLDEDGNYHPNEAMQDWDGTMVGGYIDENGNYVPNDDMYYDDQARGQEIKDAISDAVNSYGFDVEVAQQWLAEKGANYQELQQAQDASIAAQAQADIAEAADGIQGILDNMFGDLRNRTDQTSGEIDTMLDDYKEEIDRQAEENINKFADWLDSTIDTVTDSMATETDQIEEIVPVAALAAKVKEASEAQDKENVDANSVFGYGTLGLGTAAIVAYLCKKRMGVKDCCDVDDEDFQRVISDDLMNYSQDFGGYKKEEKRASPQKQHSTNVNFHDEDFIRVEDETQECDSIDWEQI